jgi:hypothetical protein
MNLSFMDFLFYVPFFCTAAAALTEILNVCLVNVEFYERKKLKVKRASHFVKIRVGNIRIFIRIFFFEKYSLFEYFF